jgi:hypothetical protein
LGEFVGHQIYYGVKTGLNEAFVIDAETRARLIAEDPQSEKIIKPFLRGRDIKRWKANPQNLWLIFTRTGIEIENYPAIERHLFNWKPQLEKRAGTQRWFELQASPAEVTRFESNKIIYPDIYKHQSFAWDDEHLYLTNTCYFISTNEKWLCGLLNTKLIEWFYSNISNSIRGGYMRAFSDYMKQIPICHLNAEQKVLLEDQVQKVLSAKAENPQADTSQWESAIDALVYEFYGLTAEEIEVVESV